MSTLSNITMVNKYIILQKGIGVMKIVPCKLNEKVLKNKDKWVYINNIKDNAVTNYIVNKKYIFDTMSEAQKYLENEC